MKKLLLFLLTAALVSCSKDYETLPSVGEINLAADATVRLQGETVTFTATDNLGEDVTDEAEFFVEGQPLSSNVFTTEEIGTYRVTAKYLGIESNFVDLIFRDPSQIIYRKRILVEDYTGTWCGYCPRVAHAIELLAQQTENFVPVAIHRASNNPTDAAYDPYNYDTTPLENMINIPGYPKGMVNRTMLWPYPEPNKVNLVLNETQGDPKLGLAMESTASGNNFNLTVRARFAEAFTGLKLVVYVLENGLIHEQHNYTTYYDGVDLIPDFTHNHVLREVLTDQLGDAVSAGETTTGHTYTRTFNAAFPANIENKDHVEFVAFLVQADGKVVNAQKVAVGATRDFEEL